MRTGRPTDYLPDTGIKIADWIAKGKPVHKIAALAGMPSERTIYRWLAEHEEFRQDYTRAREAFSHRAVAETIAIADAAPETVKGVEKARLRVQTRQWAAERMAPKKYGARVKQELSGPDDGPIEVADASAKLLDMLNRRAPAVAAGD